jgi:hypothetical protein
LAKAPSEKRRTPRIQPYVTPCKVVEGDQRIAGYLTDLSTVGARISCDAALPVGSQSVVIEVRFARRGGSSSLPARIKWMRAGTRPGEAAVFGVTFESLDAEAQALLASVVEEFQRRAALLG